MFAFFSFLIFIMIVWLCMWGFFKFMYPKPPKQFMPKEGDIITPRDCNLCGYPLAEYRGVLEIKPENKLTVSEQKELKTLTQLIRDNENKINELQNQLADNANLKPLSRQQKKQTKLEIVQYQKQLNEQRQALKKITSWFFCNYDHQDEFHSQVK